MWQYYILHCLHMYMYVLVHVCTYVPLLFLPHSSANKCTTKVAHMLAQLQKFQKAAELFEEVRG